MITCLYSDLISRTDQHYNNLMKADNEILHSVTITTFAFSFIINTKTRIRSEPLAMKKFRAISWTSHMYCLLFKHKTRN